MSHPGSPWRPVYASESKAELKLFNWEDSGNFSGIYWESNISSELYLSYNNLEGEIPGTISQLKSLSMLGLSKNSFSGEFPPALYNMTWLKLLSLSFNNFFGSLKSDFGLALPNFQRLYLAENFFSGSISASLSNASGLLQFDIPFNNFTGNVPTNYGNLNSLWWFNVLNNNLGSGAPDDFSFVTSLPNCSSLQLLDFAKNQFAGTIPSTLGKCLALEQLYMQGNSLVGSIPDFSGLKNIQFLDFSSNNLSGKIPTYMENLSSLLNLNISLNNLEGEVPVEGVFKNASAVTVGCVVVFASSICNPALRMNLRNRRSMLLSMCWYVKMALPDKIMDIVDHSALLGGSGKDASVESLNEIRVLNFHSANVDHSAQLGGPGKDASVESLNEIRVLNFHSANVDHSALLGGSGKDASVESLNEIECLTSILQIGVTCSAESPKERMNMRQVLRELISIRHKFLGTEVNEGSIDYLI
ncbi:hypothetical protein ACH5RR_010191 [Cinchona calisaya]|uniref:Uncharacterized protein n=1 Tax=Cinchona calisaya TaxID=153742 RepID=A0ABD3AHN0_9GENT